MNSSAIDSWTWKRLAATQDSPMFRILAMTAWSTALSRSASSNTMYGALPPSSIESLSRVCDACSISSRPTSVEPVNDSLRSRWSWMSGFMTLPVDDEVMIDSTPSGSPASSRISPSASIVSGVALAGLTIIVQPAAMAGPILRVPMAAGKFHGVMSRQGPTGCFIVSRRPAPLGSFDQRPLMRTASSENQRRNSAA